MQKIINLGFRIYLFKIGSIMNENIEYLAQIKKKYDNDRRYFAVFADTLLDNGKTEQAEQIVFENLQKFVNSISGILVLSKILIKKKNYQKALSILEAILKNGKKSAKIYRTCAEITMEIGDRKKTEYYLIELKKVDPLDSMVKSMVASSIVEEDLLSEENEEKEVFPLFSESEEKVESEVEPFARESHLRPKDRLEYDDSISDDELLEREGVKKEAIEELFAIHSNGSSLDDDLHIEQFDNDFDEDEDEDEDENVLKEKLNLKKSSVIDDFFRDKTHSDETDPKEMEKGKKEHEIEKEKDDSEISFLLTEDDTYDLVEESREKTAIINVEPFKHKKIEVEVKEENNLTNEQHFNADILTASSENILQRQDELDFLDEERSLDSDETPEGEPEKKSSPSFCIDDENSFKKVVVDKVLGDDNTPKKRDMKIVTSTLGEIYSAQGEYHKSKEIYYQLLKKDPENQEHKINFIEAEFGMASARINEELEYYCNLTKKHPDNRKYSDRYKSYSAELELLKKEKDAKIAGLNILGKKEVELTKE